jgi:hypothetical protein
MIEKPQFRRVNKWFVEALNALADFAQRSGVNPHGVPGWVETPKGWHPPVLSPGSEAALAPWGLRVTPDSDPVTYDVIKGDIRANDTSTAAGLAITGGENIDLVAGETIYLEIEGPAWSAPEIKSGRWSNYPDPYEVQGSGAEAEIKYYRLPLWGIFAETAPLRTGFGEGIFLRRLVTWDLALHFGVWRSDDDPPLALAAPIFLPSPGLTPE